MSIKHQMFLHTLRQVAGLTPPQVHDYQDRLLGKLALHVAGAHPDIWPRLAPMWVQGAIDLDLWAQVAADDVAAIDDLDALARIASDCALDYALEKSGVPLGRALIDACPLPSAMPDDRWTSTVAQMRRRPADTPDAMTAELADRPDAHLRIPASALTLPAGLSADAAVLVCGPQPLSADDFAQLRAQGAGTVVFLWTPLGLGVCGWATTADTLHLLPAIHRAEVEADGQVTLTAFYAYDRPVIRARTGVAATQSGPFALHLP